MDPEDIYNMSAREIREVCIENNPYIQALYDRTQKVLPALEPKEMQQLHQEFIENGNLDADSTLTQYKQNLVALFMAQQDIESTDNENIKYLSDEVADYSKDLVKAMKSNEKQAAKFVKADSQFRTTLRNRYAT